MQLRRLALVLLVLRVVAGGKPANRGGLRQLRPALLAKAAPAQGIITEGVAKAPPKPNFKLPVYHHVDSLSVFTDGWLDWFVVIYWGVFVLILLLIEVVTHFNGGVPLTHVEASTRSNSPSRQASGLSTFSDEPSPRGGSVSARSLQRSKQSVLLGSDDASQRQITLGPNFWTLNVISSLGQAKDRAGNILHPCIVFVAGISMGLLQIFVLFLVVYDIDPSAMPYTEKPSAPWKTSPLTVNCMKVAMVFFLGMSVVAEAGDAYSNFIIGMGVKSEDLLTRRFNVLLAPVFHYLITLCVILAGVSVILSCQAVPDILYNSMAILFITQVDEMFWNFWEQTFEIEAQWEVSINESEVPEVKLVKKCIVMFPMLLAFCLLGRAWYRDQMPALIVRVLATAH